MASETGPTGETHRRRGRSPEGSESRPDSTVALPLRAYVGGPAPTPGQLVPLQYWPFSLADMYNWKTNHPSFSENTPGKKKKERKEKGRGPQGPAPVPSCSLEQPQCLPQLGRGRLQLPPLILLLLESAHGCLPARPLCPPGCSLPRLLQGCKPGGRTVQRAPGVCQVVELPPLLPSPFPASVCRSQEPAPQVPWLLLIPLSLASPLLLTEKLLSLQDKCRCSQL